MRLIIIRDNWNFWFFLVLLELELDVLFWGTCAISRVTCASKVSEFQLYYIECIKQLKTHWNWFHTNHVKRLPLKHLNYKIFIQFVRIDFFILMEIFLIELNAKAVSVKIQNKLLPLQHVFGENQVHGNCTIWKESKKIWY